MYSGGGNRRGSLLNITGLSVLINLSVSIFYLTAANHATAFVVGSLDKQMQNEKELIRLASAPEAGVESILLAVDERDNNEWDDPRNGRNSFHPPRGKWKPKIQLRATGYPTRTQDRLRLWD